MTDEYAIVSVDDDGAKILVQGHDGIEVGEFTIGCNESFYYFGHNWIVTENTVAGKYYFYYKFQSSFSKATFFIDITDTADEAKGLQYFNDYDEILITYVKDKTTDPDSYTYTWWYFEEEDFSKREEVISIVTDDIKAAFYDDSFVSLTDETTSEIKGFNAQWTDPALKTWSTV